MTLVLAYLAMYSIGFPTSPPITEGSLVSGRGARRTKSALGKYMELLGKEFYVGLAEAGAELASRSYLRPAVEQWWKDRGLSMPELLTTSLKPQGFLCRQLATFRYEDATFVIMAEKAGLSPAWLPYEGDVFADISPLKRSYIEPVYVAGVGRNGGMRKVGTRLVSGNVAELNGRPLMHVVTNQGTSLVDYHCGNLRTLYNRAQVADVTPILRKAGGTPRRYYPALLSLLVAHGVLFEDYHGGESGGKLSAFTTDVFEPAFQQVEQTFGVKPLIVRLPWWGELGHYVSPELSKVIHWRAHWFALRDLAIR